VFNFEQLCRATYPTIAAPAGALQGGIMAVTKNNKHKDYCRYAALCLEVVPTLTEKEARAALLEMAAEWLKLADEIIEPSKVIQLSKVI
jgi:hypothetical protein